MRARPLSASLLLSALALSCAGAPANDVPRRETSRAATGRPDSARPDSGWGGSRLYARDGTVVADEGAPAAPPPEIGPAAASPRELAPSEGGRMYILELYQRAIDERDALEGELRALQGELARAREMLLGTDRSASDLQGEVDRLTVENRRLAEENLDLAARLTTAQIRRLQVEKVLLEARIAEFATAPPVPAGAAAEMRK
jgi:hypothetical protein